ncbi:MAG: 30S ribosomal protein S3ae, partial [Nanohaloarchaea archaeon SW_7_46_7]
EQTYEEIMENIFQDNLQEELRDAVDEIYPFRELEVRKTEIRE